ncbi:MAG: hypothetical protein ACLFRY_13150 [Spirochaetia bacterium]
MEQNRQLDDRPREEDTISLLDLLGVLAKRWKLIFFSTLIAAILIVLYSLYTLRVPPDAHLNTLPNVYKPTVEVRLQEENGAASFLNQDSGLGALIGIGGQGKSTNVALAQELLLGRTIVDQIAEEFDFRNRYEFEVPVAPKIRKMIREKFSTDFDQESGILTIGYTDVDPEFATRIVNRAVTLLEQRFRGLTMEKVLNKKRFLEDRLFEVETQLKNAQTELIQFQIRHGIVEIIPSGDNDTNGAVELVFAQYTRPERRHTLTLEYFDLQRDREVLAGIFELLMQQFETAKIEEMDDTRTFQILEQAEVPEIKDSPSRGKISIIVTLTTFFLSIFLAFILEYFDRVKQDPEEARKLEQIKNRFRISSRKR